MENKNQISKKEKLIILAVILIMSFLVIFFVFGDLLFVKEDGERTREEEGLTADREEFYRETGLSPVQEERVVTRQGEEVRYDVAPGSPEAPQQSAPHEEDQTTADAIRIRASRDEGYMPSEFTARAGQLITLTITSADDRVYVFKFEEPLSSVAVGVGPGETRSINFNAPDSKGEYKFLCDVPGCNIEGKMIVQ